MKNLTKILALSLATLFPLQALADFTLPSQVFGVVQQDAAATRTFSGQVHGRVGQTFVSLWMNGTQQGESIADMQSVTAATFDMVYNQWKLRVKFEAQVMQGNAYVRIKSVEGSADTAVASFSLNMLQKKWLMVNGSDYLPDQSLTKSYQDMFIQMTDELFSLQSTKFPGGVAYTLTLKPEQARELSSALMSIAPEAAGLLPPDAMQGAVTLTMKIDTDAKSHVLSQNISFGMTGSDMEFHGEAKSQRMLKTLSLKPPAGALTIDQFTQAFESLWPASDFWTPSFSEGGPGSLPDTNEPGWVTPAPSEDSGSSSSSGDEWDDVWNPETGTDTHVTPDEANVCNPQAPGYLENLRSGQCAPVKPSRR